MTNDEILQALGWRNSFSTRMQINKSRSELVQRNGIKSAVFRYVQDLDAKHLTNNMLPLHLLRKSIADTLKSTVNLNRRLLDQYLIELDEKDMLIELIPLQSHKRYHPNVISNGISTQHGKILYFIQQRIETPRILESSVKLDPRIQTTSSDLGPAPSKIETAKSKQQSTEPIQFLKTAIDRLDLSSPKLRASQIAFMLNNDLRDHFEIVCKQQNISIREGLHVALIVFCKHFKL